MTRAWTRTCAAYWLRNGRILLMLWRVNLQEQVVAVKDSWSFSVTPWFLTVRAMDPTEFSILTERAWMGVSFPGWKSSSVLLRLSFSWCADFYWEMLSRHTEIRSATWVLDRGKVRVICIAVVEKAVRAKVPCKRGPRGRMWTGRVQSLRLLVLGEWRGGFGASPCHTLLKGPAGWQQRRGRGL